MVIQLTDPVGAARHSMLPLLATWIHGDAVGVEVTAEASEATQVSCFSKTLVLHPQRSSMLSVFIAAQLLQRRDEVGALLCTVPPHIVRIWVQRARAQLVSRFPALGQLSEVVWSRALDGAALPVVRWTGATVRPALGWRAWTPDERKSAGLQGDTVASLRLPDCRVSGGRDVIGDLVAAIARGDLEPSHLPELPDVPYVAVAVAVGSRMAVPEAKRELLEMREGLVRDAAVKYAECLRQTLEGEPFERSPPVRTWSGVRLDTQRLVDVRVAARVRRETRVFTREEDPPTVFDPSRHRAVVYATLASHGGTLGRPAGAPGLAVAVAHAYELLEIETELHAALDYWVEGPGRRRVVLHLDFLIKRPEEPWTGLVWERMRRVRDLRVGMAMEPTVFPPLYLHRCLPALGPQGPTLVTNERLHAVVLCASKMRGMEAVRDAPRRFAVRLEAIWQGSENSNTTRGTLALPDCIRSSLSADSPLSPLTLS